MCVNSHSGHQECALTSNVVYDVHAWSYDVLLQVRACCAALRYTAFYLHQTIVSDRQRLEGYYIRPSSSFHFSSIMALKIFILFYLNVHALAHAFTFIVRLGFLHLRQRRAHTCASVESNNNKWNCIQRSPLKLIHNNIDAVFFSFYMTMPHFLGRNLDKTVRTVCVCVFFCMNEILIF